MDTEFEAVKLAKEGNQNAYRVLYELNFKSLFKFVSYKVSNDHIAEDIVSEAFTRSFENIDKYKGRSTFKTYLYTIAKNLVFDYYKTKYKAERLEDNVISKQSEDDDTDQKGDLRVLVSGVLENLKEREREVIELRFICELSVEDSAKALAISESNIKVITHRALEKLKKIYINKSN